MQLVFCLHNLAGVAFDVLPFFSQVSLNISPTPFVFLAPLREKTLFTGH